MEQLEIFDGHLLYCSVLYPIGIGREVQSRQNADQLMTDSRCKVIMATMAMAMEIEIRPKIFISGRDPRPAYRHPLHTNKAFEYFNVMRK